MNNIKLLENYEIVMEGKKAVLTYDISEAEILKNTKNAFILAKEKENSYDLVVSNEEGEDLIVFKNMKLPQGNDIENKTLFIVGLNASGGEIESITKVLNFSIEKNRKLKIS